MFLLGIRRGRISLSLEEGLAGYHQTLVYNVRRIDLTASLQLGPNAFHQPDRSPPPNLFTSPKTTPGYLSTGTTSRDKQGSPTHHRLLPCSPPSSSSSGSSTAFGFDVRLALDSVVAIRVCINGWKIWSGAASYLRTG